MSTATEKKLDHLNWPLALCTVIICALGVWNLASATKSLPDPLWAKQAAMMGLGVVAIGIFLFVDYRWLQTLAWPGYFAALLLLAGVAFKGKKVLGARRWLQVGPMQLQPSEFVKLAVIVLMARYFSRDETGARKGQYGILDVAAVLAHLVARRPGHEAAGPGYRAGDVLRRLHHDHVREGALARPGHPRG